MPSYVSYQRSLPPTLPVNQRKAVARSFYWIGQSVVVLTSLIIVVIIVTTNTNLPFSQEKHGLKSASLQQQQHHHHQQGPTPSSWLWGSSHEHKHHEHKHKHHKDRHESHGRQHHEHNHEQHKDKQNHKHHEQHKGKQSNNHHDKEDKHEQKSSQQSPEEKDKSHKKKKSNHKAKKSMGKKETSLPTPSPTTTKILGTTPVPTVMPTLSPTLVPTIFPMAVPTLLPTLEPTFPPTSAPTLAPSMTPTTNTPTTLSPMTDMPTVVPTALIQPATQIPSNHPATTTTTTITVTTTITPTNAPVACAILSTPAPTTTVSGDKPWHSCATPIEGSKTFDSMGSVVALVQDNDTQYLAVGGRNQVQVYQRRDMEASSFTPLGNPLPGRRIAVAITITSHSRLVVATTMDNQVQIYEYDLLSNNPEWTIKGQPLDGTDRFGWSLALEGDLLVVGTYPILSGTQAAGYVNVYRFDDTQWQLEIQFPGDTAGDMFGYSVALSRNGQTLACGAPNAHRSAVNPQFGTGLVRVYAWNDGAQHWERKGSDLLIPSVVDETGSSDPLWFGYAVSLSTDGSVVAVTTNRVQGQARVFLYQDKDWTAMGDLVHVMQQEPNGEQFGDNIQISGAGTLVAVGGSRVNATGEVRLYRFSDATWTRVGPSFTGTNRNDSFGDAISLTEDGKTLAVGSDRYDTPTSTSAGHVQVYCTT